MPGVPDSTKWTPSRQGGYVPPSTTDRHGHRGTDLDSGSLTTRELAASVLSLLVPVGVISAYYGSSAPTGWLICDGSTFSAATYPALNTLLGGTTLPNLKGRVVVGVDAAQTEFDVIGETGGAKTHVLTTAELASHTHIQDAHAHSLDGRADDPTSTGSWYNDVEQTTQGVQSSVNNGVQNATATNQTAGSGTAHNNLQPYIAYNYIIKAA